LAEQKKFSQFILQSGLRSSGFLKPGKHTFDLKYTCLSVNCGPDIKQYGGKVRLIQLKSDVPFQEVGPHVKKLFLDTPDSRLNILGTSNPRFDGENIFRQVRSKDVQISWKDSQFIGIRTYVFTDEEARVIFTVGEKKLKIYI